MRAPLRAIDGYARILVEDHLARLDLEGQRVLGVISSETKRMGELIDDLLSFSRLGRQALRSAPIDLHGLVQTVFRELIQLEPERTFRLEVPDTLPVVYGDPAMIRQLLVNLLGNAVKYTRGREVAVIEVGAGKERSDGVMEKWSNAAMADSSTPTLQHSSTPVIFVRDNGVGFDIQYAGKLFGVFQRLHSAGEFEGTGVGLALVQRIVHRHGGRIWAEAKLNAGATFYFTLPGREGVV